MHEPLFESAAFRRIRIFINVLTGFGTKNNESNRGHQTITLSKKIGAKRQTSKRAPAAVYSRDRRVHCKMKIVGVMPLPPTKLVGRTTKYLAELM